MSVFPITWTDKQDSPELLAYLAQYGPEFYVNAAEINKIRDGLNELFNSVGGGTGLINMNGFYPSGQDYIFPAFRVWKINGTVHSNATQISINIPYAASGKHRIDAIAAMPDDTIIRVPGAEVLISNSAAEPSIPPGSIRVTAIPVNESGYGIPEPPILINQFVKKNEFAEVIFPDSGDVTIGLDTESRSFRLTGEVTSIIGFEMSDVFISDNLYPNQLIKVANNTGGDFPITHNGASTYPARFPSEVDFILKNNQVAFFQPVKTDVLHLEFFGVSRDTFEPPVKYVTTRRWVALGGASTSITNDGTPALTSIGTLVSNPIDGPLGSSRLKMVSNKSNTTAGSSCGWHNAGVYDFFKDKEGDNIIYFKIQDPVLVANGRFFIGFKNSIGAIGNVNPSTLLNAFSIGQDSGETTMHVMHNGSKINLPAFTVNNTDLYRLTFKSNGVDTFSYKLENLTNPAVVTGSVPSFGNVFLFQIWRNNGIDAAEVRIGFSEVIINDSY